MSLVTLSQQVCAVHESIRFRVVAAVFCNWSETARVIIAQSGAEQNADGIELKQKERIRNTRK